MSGATSLDLIAIQTDSTGYAGTFRTLIGAGTSSFNGAYSSLSGIPSSFPPSAHTHSYNTLTDIPTSFTPSAHTHAIADTTGLQAALDGKQATIGYTPADDANVIHTTGNETKAGTLRLSDPVGINRAAVTNTPMALQVNASTLDGLYIYNSAGVLIADFGTQAGGSFRARFRSSVSGVLTSFDAGVIVTTSWITSVFRSAAANPTTTDLTSGQGVWWKNTTLNEIRYWVNDGGTMRSSAALT